MEYIPKKNYKYLDMNYLKNSCFGDVAFIKELLEISCKDFNVFIAFLRSVYDESIIYDKEQMFYHIHRFKPSVIMYNLPNQAFFKKYGSTGNYLAFPEYKEYAPSIIETLTGLVLEIEEEIDHIITVYLQ